MAFFQHKEQRNHNGEWLSPKEQFISSIETKVSLPTPKDKKKFHDTLKKESATIKQIDTPVSLGLTPKQKTMLSQIDSN